MFLYDDVCCSSICVSFLSVFTTTMRMNRDILRRPNWFTNSRLFGIPLLHPFITRLGIGMRFPILLRPITRLLLDCAPDPPEALSDFLDIELIQSCPKAFFENDTHTILNLTLRFEFIALNSLHQTQCSQH